MKKALVNITNDTELKDLDTIEKKNIYTIETVTPISIENKYIFSENVIVNYWLCKLTNGELIILCCNFITDIQEEKDILVKSVPYHEDNTFMNHSIMCNMLLSKFPVYLSDFLFYESEDGKIEIVSKLLAKDNKVDENIVYFNFSLDIFATFAYTENYITDSILNYHDISLATLYGARVPETETVLYNISDIDILSVVSIDKKKKSIGILLRTESKDEESTSYNILIPFESNVKINKRKTKGATIEKIQDSYLSNEDEYVSLFMFEARIEDMDKEYLFIKAKNKDEKSILFTMDSAVRQILLNKIADF